MNLILSSQADAAKIVIHPSGNNLTNQVRLPIPPHAPASLFVVWMSVRR